MNAVLLSLGVLSAFALPRLRGQQECRIDKPFCFSVQRSDVPACNVTQSDLA